MLSQPRLILASGSRYRQELLSRLQFAFSVRSPDIDESRLDGESPPQTALRLARQKAEAIARTNSEAVIIGSDQVAHLDGEHIGKPGTHANALIQLKKMQGRSVVFHTALCVLDGRDVTNERHVQTATIDTTVLFRTLSEVQLDAYLRIEQPYDCAGSAKNEGLGIALIASIRSEDPTALTGLPLIALCSMLSHAGFTFFSSTPIP
jgi:septum formation protein